MTHSTGGDFSTETPASILPYSQSQIKPMRLRYTIALPSIWLALMASLWYVSWGSEAVMGPMTVGLPGLWLPIALHVWESALQLAVTQCVGGIIVMGLLGLLEDYLRVHPAWMWSYLIGLACGIASLGHLPMRVALDVGFLCIWTCVGLYAVSVLLSIGGGVLAIRRWLHRQSVLRGTTA
jgi:hypothetical protein